MSSSSSSSLLDQYMAALASGTNSANANGSSNANAVPDPASSSNSRIQNLVRNNRNRTNPNASANRGFASVHFTENRHRIRLCLDLPGVLSQDLSVQMQHGVLLIQGTRLLRRFSSLPSHLGSTASNTDDQQEPICYRQQHKFCRRFAIDTDVVDATRIRANLDPRTGTLQIVAPKMDRPKALRIEVTNYALEDDPHEEESELEAMQEEEEEEMTEEVMAAADRAAAPTSLSKARSAQSIASTAAAVAALTVAAAAGEEKASKANQDITTESQQPVSESSPSQEQQQQQVPLLRNVVSMGSAADALEAAEAMVSVRRLLGNHHHSHHHSNHHSRASMKSHLMMRRSMSNPKVNKIV